LVGLVYVAPTATATQLMRMQLMCRESTRAIDANQTYIWLD
jgi:hypothetical protein